MLLSTFTDEKKKMAVPEILPKATQTGKCRGRNLTAAPSTRPQ